MALDLQEKAVSLAGGNTSSSIYEGSSYKEFQNLYAPDADESIIQHNYSSDCSWWTEADQHFATVVAEDYPYYLIETTNAICAGAYPEDFSCSYNQDIIIYVMTEDGLRYSGNEEELEKLNSDWSSFPEGFQNAHQAGRNLYGWKGDDGCWNLWYKGENKYIKGAVLSDLEYAWIDENGNLWFGLNLSNGTEENRSFNINSVTMTDDTLGTIYDGPVDEPEVVKGYSSKLMTFSIPASEVSHADEPWDCMEVSWNETKK